MTSPLYAKALILGATSGIGLSLANKLMSTGSKVVVTGRRQDRLDEFVAANGGDKAAACAFAFALDVTDPTQLRRFAKTVAVEHPDIDCVVFNAGIQRMFNFAQPESVDLDALALELNTNYLSAVQATMALLPILQKHDTRVGSATPTSTPTPTPAPPCTSTSTSTPTTPTARSATATATAPPSLVYISATLGLVPSMLRTGNYNASKAALHSWIMVFREQLRQTDAGSRVPLRVVEVFPPAVQTELHDERHQPDLRNGGAIGMPLEAFTDAVFAGLQAGDEQFGVGDGPVATLRAFEADRQQAFREGMRAIEGLLKPYVKDV